MQVSDVAVLDGSRLTLAASPVHEVVKRAGMISQELNRCHKLSQHQRPALATENSYQISGGTLPAKGCPLIPVSGLAGDGRDSSVPRKSRASYRCCPG